MDTPIIVEYYRETDSLKRKKLLEISIANGEEPEANEIRKEIWEIRHKDKLKDGTPMDSFMKLWMHLEFNRDSRNHFGGNKRAVRELKQILEEIHFQEIIDKGGLYEKLLYRECVNLVALYMDLCEHDRTYGTGVFGLVPLKKESLENKLRTDIYQTAVQVPEELGLKRDLVLLTQAAREAYSQHFSGEKMPDEIM